MSYTIYQTLEISWCGKQRKLPQVSLWWNIWFVADFMAFEHVPLYVSSVTVADCADSSVSDTLCLKHAETSLFLISNHFEYVQTACTVMHRVSSFFVVLEIRHSRRLRLLPYRYSKMRA